jgi:hypothetical protein
MPLLARYSLDVGAVGFGALNAAMGVGSLLGALLLTPYLPPGLRSVTFAALGFSLSLLAVALVPNYSTVLVLLGPLGLISVAYSTSTNTTLQLWTGEAYRGRVLSLYTLLFMGTTPIGGAITGVLADQFGINRTLAVEAVLCLVARRPRVPALGSPRHGSRKRYPGQLMPPPTGSPPVLLTLDYATQQPALPEPILDVAHYESGGLRVVSSLPDSSQGIAAADLMFRDTVLQASLSMTEGTEDDLYGVFLRSPSDALYYAFAVSPTGHAYVASYDGEFAPIVSGPLDPDMVFHYGLGRPNRFQVVAVGPSLTFILNGMLVTAEIVDERYQEGYLGYFVHHGLTSPRAELAVDWVQVRGLFPSG